jgi:BolA family transcriptional regulator, general stress-responsive regulator
VSLKELIEQRLLEDFNPQTLNVIDESHQHHGHAGWREGGETHFRVKIVSEAFIGKSRIDCHRAINAALSGAFAAGLHALAIDAKAPTG